MQTYRPIKDPIEGRQPFPSLRVGYESIDIVGRHRRVVFIAHRRLERAAILADARRDGALDLLVAPAPDPLGLARCDVARDGDAPRAAEFKPSRAKGVPLPSTP